ncbi:MAG: class I SAM-dependent methyltransferase [Microcoleus sp. PH2017_10_PVI_O_A]|uniref:class I SAM-dependent methyltransferase n=2 Tax=Microcoleus TaxID=44471 RepID=UPI001DF8867A|nr:MULTISPECIES: class I SAM-dependent methyltransferase [unclassified Microcoleus]MCC3529840.1 class I SAM-dependent methyltransferase [Microcoleus sp. PH2017_21_RUC_O_A]TAE83888.1 MAG: class I SAM-dependent methyltransferase [Oscillatoriales cyanobacterium]MCC3405762.1 class I SAM-dependent methyltransferase [Microcoleus sp. PH2017_10_PVI_O_A]MCC3459724.1 class I SAM-dependent methyltransferase [Microcoleus sp. PH2017_11_PCY_U_A]MCC3477770.1 class I SAM-dependent methyltransferase [Microcole
MTDNSKPPLYEMNPLGRFSDRTADYVKYRPTYPAAAIDAILAGLGEPSQLTAADIGAGTGISSRLLAERGLRVLAIEPNTEMRQAAAAHPLVEFRDGTSEASNLPDQSLDLVACFQSFHWFNPVLTLPEFRRILKPSGRLAVVWNLRDRADALTEGYTQIVKSASNNHPASKRDRSIEPLLASADFTDVRSLEFANKQDLDLAGLIGRARSSSYMPNSGSPLQKLISDLTELYQAHCGDRGFVSLVYKTIVYLGNPTDC